MGVALAAGNYIQVADNAALNTDGTCVWWMRTTQATAARVASKLNVGVQRGWRVAMNATTGFLQAENWQSSIQNRLTITGAVAVNDGNWHCCGYNWQQGTGANGSKLYVDGTLDVQGTNSTAWSWLLASNPRFGVPEGGSPGNFTGDYGGIAWWNVNLTADEHAQLAQGAPPYMIRPTALVFYIPGFEDARELKGITTTSVSGTSQANRHHRYLGN